MVLTPEDIDQLQKIARETAAVSLVAALCIFFDLKKTWATMRKSPSRIIFWWTISITILIPPMMLSRMYVPQSPSEESSAICRFQGTIITFGSLSSICWAGCIAANLLIALKWKFDIKVLMEAEKFYHKLCWGLPAFVSILLLLVPDVYGDAVFWCWIDVRYEWLRMIMINIPTVLTMATSLIIYGLVAKEISRTFDHSSHAEGNYLEVRRRRVQATNRFTMKCSLYLLAFFMTHSGEVALYIAMLISPDPPYNIYVMMAITIPGAGAFTGAAYFAARLLKPPKGGISTQNSFNSGGSKNSFPVENSVIRSADINSERSVRSGLTDGTIPNDSPIAGSLRGSTVPTIDSTPSSTFQFHGFNRNTALMPSLPPSVHKPNL